ncbi:MAG: fused MFS/spermidine synthase [Acidobacteria bacterium]|nr:fused MFS/spermidine synthase [Acidobacteriota bacterium]
MQPIISKLILPWFGGVAAVWSVCQLFFQTMLLLGYLYAYLLTRNFRPSTQARLHALFLTLSIAFLPILPRDYWKPSGSEDPGLRVLLLLTVSVGMPYFLLSATSPLIQAWYSRVNCSPYRLYAWSNAGSMLGLLSYPILVEPRISNHHQAIFWSAAYALVVALCAAATLAGRNRVDYLAVVDAGLAPGWKTRLLWASLAACGSALLLSITNYISQNIAAVPLLWIVPLSLYLLTFVICFEDLNWYHRWLSLKFVAVALAAMAYAISAGHHNLPPYVLVPLFSAGLFACCMVCHGELARLRPHPAYLTSFYLLISLGGAVGALFVAWLAPRIFTAYYELPLTLGFCGALIVIVLYRDLVVEGKMSRYKPWFRLASTVVAVFCASLYIAARKDSAKAAVRLRNFYGALRVEQRAASGVAILQAQNVNLREPDRRYLDLINGTIEHGVQFLASGRRREATTYYGPNSGISLALRSATEGRQSRVGIIGLGVGTIAAYGRTGDQYTFYEINPLIIELANHDFSFIRDSAAQVNIVPGDGRLALERQAPQEFDVLAVDAFSSDAIPTHLLTREAFQLYLRHIKPAGIIAVHVSNRYLDLIPVVAGAAACLGRPAVVIESGADDARVIYRATWVLVTNEVRRFEQIEPTARVLQMAANSAWTDDYSSLLHAFK